MHEKENPPVEYEVWSLVEDDWILWATATNMLDAIYLRRQHPDSLIYKVERTLIP